MHLSPLCTVVCLIKVKCLAEEPRRKDKREHRWDGSAYLYIYLLYIRKYIDSGIQWEFLRMRLDLHMDGLHMQGELKRNGKNIWCIGQLTTLKVYHLLISWTKRCIQKSFIKTWQCLGLNEKYSPWRRGLKVHNSVIKSNLFVMNWHSLMKECVRSYKLSRFKIWPFWFCWVYIHSKNGFERFWYYSWRIYFGKQR